ncbi:MAG: hypothetical protein ACOC22_02570 [bacterium]
MFNVENISKMELEDNDLVILEFPEGTSSEKIRKIIEEIKKTKETLEIDNPFIIIKGTINFKKLPEEELNKNGWYKLTEDQKRKLGIS